MRTTLLCASLILLSLSARAETTTEMFGPVVLHEGSRFEICANARYSTYNVRATASFVGVSDGKMLEKSFELDPGRGGCFSLPFEKAGDQPVFATLEVYGEPGDTDVVASAAIINGIFNIAEGQTLVDDQGLRTATSFGPVVIAEGKRLQVCANNWQSNYPSAVMVNFYRTKNSSKPISSMETVLEPGEGGCATISQEVTGKSSVFAELLTEPVEKGFSNPLPISGALIINGIFEQPVPSDLRFVPDR